LKPPVLTWNRQRGLCGSILAVDADGQLWVDEGGCEDGSLKLSSRGQSDRGKVAALREAFDTLPKNFGPGSETCSGNLDVFSERIDTEWTESRTCSSSGGYDDLTGLQDPYLSVAKAFLALP
jgi:hypothetical protein